MPRFSSVISVFFRRLVATTIAVTVFIVAVYTEGSVPTTDAEAAPHPLDVALDREIAPFSPSSRTASIYWAFEEKWDEELNRVYKTWIAELDASRRIKLQAAQRAWIAFRDAEKKLISVAYLMDGGDSTPTMALSFAAYREMMLTRERSLALALLRQRWLETRADKTATDPDSSSLTAP